MEQEQSHVPQPPAQPHQEPESPESFFDNYQSQESEQQEKPPEKPPEQPKNDLKQWEDLTRKERQIWRERKQVKDMEAKLKQEREEIDRLRKNPKELLGVKDNKDIEGVISSLFEEEEQKPENDHKDPSELRKEIEEEVYNRIKEEQKKEKEKEQIDTQLKEFQNNVKKYVEENEQNYPLVSGMGESGLITEVIQAKYEQDLNAYGEDQANKMMISVEEAGRRVEKYLETQVNQVLQSPQVRSYVQKILQGQEDPPDKNRQESNYEQSNYGPKTLNNNDFSNPTPNRSVDEGNLTDEEAFERALATIR